MLPSSNPPLPTPAPSPVSSPAVPPSSVSAASSATAAIGLVRDLMIANPKPAPAARSIFAALVVIVLVGLTVPAGWMLPTGYNLLGILALMSLVLIVLGWAITENPLGVLINDLNVMSLSRFQMVGWTVVILAAYYTYVLVRMKQGDPDALKVVIDKHLWVLLGLSTTSLVGSALIQNTKKNKEPDDAVTDRTAVVTAEPKIVVEANRQGTLYANTNKDDARFTDLFQGDELVNTTHVDLTKVQMFYFTVIALVAFVLMVAKNLHSLHPDLAQLPVPPDGLIAVLTISHAGYLTGKSVSQTPLETPSGARSQG